MKIITILIGLPFLLSLSIFAQEYSLYTPLEIQNAYKNRTRSTDGRPGVNYWQNRSEYIITAEVDPVNDVLIGSEEIYYYNNSPDTLDKIILRLYQDVNKIGNPRDYDTPKADISDGVNITFLAINDNEVTNISNLDRYGTNMYIPLPEKLKPGKRLKLNVAWNYKFATEDLLRGSGKCSDGTYFVSYWYPQVAVYDDISGWDEYEYKGLAEFYNDFSDYDVEIRVPEKFIVWSTGVLQNPEEVLTKKYLENYLKASASDEIISVIGPNDHRTGGITVHNGMNTWHYKAENIPDFAFGASDRYLWDMTSLVVDKKTGRRTVIGVAYNGDSKQFTRSAEICRKTINYLSTELPGIPYPFPAMTIFEGTSAMEYPMMVNIRRYIDTREWLFISTLTHEITHSYFPFYMGTNERKYAFMDEGWAHMLPLALQTEEIRKVRKGFDARIMNNIWNYELDAGKEKHDRPPAVLTVNADGYSYHIANHNRPGAAYYFMLDILGEELFKSALQEFMNRWHHRHPAPCDFYNTFNDVTGEDLSWYWKPWLFEFGYPDLAIKELYENFGKRTVLIQKKGIIPIPIKLKVTFEDDSETNFYKTARVWDKRNTVCSINLYGDKKIKTIELGDAVIPDIDRSNNVLHVE